MMWTNIFTVLGIILDNKRNFTTSLSIFWYVCCLAFSLPVIHDKELHIVAESGSGIMYIIKRCN